LDLSKITTGDVDLIEFFKKYFEGETKDPFETGMNLKIFKLRPPIKKDGASLEYSFERIDCFSDFTETFFRGENRNWRAHLEFIEQKKLRR